MKFVNVKTPFANAIISLNLLTKIDLMSRGGWMCVMCGSVSDSVAGQRLSNEKNRDVPVPAQMACPTRSALVTHIVQKVKERPRLMFEHDGFLETGRSEERR